MRRYVVPLTLLLVVLLTVGSPAALGIAPRTLHVSPSGSDSADGTASRPWRTLAVSFGRLQAGDTLVVHGGDYVERIDPSNLPAGTADLPIRVVAAPAERPVVRGMLRLPNPHYWVVDGVNVTYEPGLTRTNDNLVKLVNGVGWTFRNAEVWGAHATAGILVGSTTSGEPSDWRITGVCVHDTVPTNSYSQDHNMYVVGGQADPGPGIIERSILFGAPNGNNLKLGPPSPDVPGGQNVTVRRNTMYDAQHNIMAAWTAENDRIEWNLFDRGPNGYGQEWYPNVRGFDLSRDGNVALANYGVGGPDVVINRGASGSTPQEHPIVDGGGNVAASSSGFRSVGSCDAFRPSGSATAFGRFSPSYGVKYPGDRIRRVDGASRIATSVAVSKVAFPDNGSVDTVVIAYAGGYPDALAGAPLAAAAAGPMLLTGKAQLDSEVASEIRRLGATSAIVLGGTGSISSSVVTTLRNLGLDVRRVAGATRFATAVRVGEELRTFATADVTHAYLVEGRNADPNRGWPDAVTVAGLAAQTSRPLLITDADQLPGEIEEALAAWDLDAVTIVGGSGAVSSAVETRLRQLVPTVTRISGTSRFATSRAVADEALREGASAASTWLATGLNYPDALAAGPAVAASGGVLLLLHGQDLGASPDARDWVQKHRPDIGEALIVGGYGSVAVAIEDEVRRRLPL